MQWVVLLLRSANRLDDNMNITEEKIAHIVYTNTDLTEGRGCEYPLYVCESLTTAKRLCEGKYVQGCNAPICSKQIYAIDGTWYGPIKLETPTKKDKVTDVKRALCETIRRKMEKAGISLEELEFIIKEGKI